MKVLSVSMPVIAPVGAVIVCTTGGEAAGSLSGLSVAKVLRKMKMVVAL